MKIIISKNIKESGKGFVKTKCMRCGKEQRTSEYIWNSGRAKCKDCGGRLDMFSGQISNDIKANLKSKIDDLENDPETGIGENISNEIHVLNRNPIEVFQEYGVTEEQAQKMMEKAIVLFQTRKKLNKIDPNYSLEHHLSQN